MSYRDDKIKLLEMVCAGLPPSDFIEDNRKVILYEKDLQKEGFSYNSAFNLLKEMHDSINNFAPITSDEGEEGISFTVNSGINDELFDLKYPNHDIETEIEEIERERVNIYKTIPEKISITIDDTKGIYQTDKPDKVYQIKIPSKKFSLIQHLRENEKIALSDFEEKLEQDKTVIMKAIKETNDTFMEKLSVTDPLIIRNDTGGYSLNKDKFILN